MRNIVLDTRESSLTPFRGAKSMHAIKQTNPDLWLDRILKALKKERHIHDFKASNSGYSIQA